MGMKEDLDRLMSLKPGRVVAIHEDDAREIVRDAIAPLTARISELEAENAQLMVERNEALAMRRWNIDRSGEGEVLVCRGHHDKGEDCDHERFVPEERLATATAETANLRAEVEAKDGALKVADEALAPFSRCAEVGLPYSFTGADFVAAHEARTALARAATAGEGRSDG